jgi:hypothetical protein
MHIPTIIVSFFRRLRKIGKRKALAYPPEALEDQLEPTAQTPPLSSPSNPRHVVQTSLQALNLALDILGLVSIVGVAAAAQGLKQVIDRLNVS